MSRYLVGLLIFLGLLGTFWGLLETVRSIGGAIEGWTQAAQSATLFDQLKQGLRAAPSKHGPVLLVIALRPCRIADPGLPRSQAAQAQNRFYIDLEDWQSSITDIAAGEQQMLAAGPVSGIAPQLLRSELQSLQRAVERLTSPSKTRSPRRVVAQPRSRVVRNQSSSLPMRWQTSWRRCARSRSWCASGRRASRPSRMKSSVFLIRATVRFARRCGAGPRRG